MIQNRSLIAYSWVWLDQWSSIWALISPIGFHPARIYRSGHPIHPPGLNSRRGQGHKRLKQLYYRSIGKNQLEREKKWAAEAEEGGTELAHRESTSERTEKMYGSVADTSPPTQTPTLVGSLSPPKTRPLMSTTRYLMWMCWWSHDPFSLLGSMLTASVFDSLNWIFFSLLNRCTVFLYLWLRRLFSLVNLLNWVFCIITFHHCWCANFYRVKWDSCFGWRCFWWVLVFVNFPFFHFMLSAIVGARDSVPRRVGHF